jgi:sulfite reductase (NADPH) flavoprotein alpha-component
MSAPTRTTIAVRLAARQRLSRGEGKEVCELLLEADQPIAYESGDWLAVAPKNGRIEVKRLQWMMGASGYETISLRGSEVPLRVALAEQVDMGVVPRALGELILGKCGGEKRRALEGGLAGDFAAFCAGWSVGDFLEHFSGEIFPCQEIVPALRPLQPRLYSIASSPAVHRRAVRLVVATATHVARGGELRYGVSSSYLNRQLAVGDSLRCYPVRTRFRLPEERQRDIIMVGPGAGIAPFIGFLEQREADGREGKAVGRSWLFFGDRHRNEDFIFEERLNSYLKNGQLNGLDLAFSRDQEQKIYVQDRMRERGEELFRWLSGGAHFYVCGDGKRMAKDVEAVLVELFMRYGGHGAEAAAERVAAMGRERRYQRDVY